MAAPWWAYDELPSREPYSWPDDNAGRGTRPDDQLDHHVDLGAGRQRKGRLAIDHRPSDDTDLVIDLGSLMIPADVDWEHPAVVRTRQLYDSFPDDPLLVGLPFPDDSIKSIITHHCLEHLRDIIPLMDECYRVLEPGGIMRIIVPLFPSHAAVADPDHRSYFAEGTFRAFTGDPVEGTCWSDPFAEPYTQARFVLPEWRGSYPNPDTTPPPLDARLIGTEADQREMRVTLVKPSREKEEVSS